MILNSWLNPATSRTGKSEMCHTFTWIARGESLDAQTKRETLARIGVDELVQASDGREQKGALKLTH